MYRKAARLVISFIAAAITMKHARVQQRRSLRVISKTPRIIINRGLRESRRARKLAFRKNRPKVPLTPCKGPRKKQRGLLRLAFAKRVEMIFYINFDYLQTGV